MVALEARAAGKYIVGYRAGSLPEVVPERAGWLVPPGDRQSLSEGIARELVTRHDRMPGPKSWGKVGEDYLNFYKEVISKRETG